jgi:hypothetical protein
MDDKKRIWIFVGAGCVVLLLGTCCLIGLGVYVFKSTWDNVGDTAAAYLEDVREGRLEEAYGRMAPEYQQERDLEAFRQDLARTPDLLTHTDAIIQGREFGTEGVRVTGMLATPRGTVRFGILLDEYDDGLRVLGVQVDDGQQPPPLPAPDIAPDSADAPEPDAG